MHARRNNPVGYLLALLLILGSFAAHAATESVQFSNDAEMNYGFYFSDDVTELQFVDLRLRGQMNSWNVDVLTAEAIVFSGPTVLPPRGRMRLTFDYQVPQVSFQYATALFDGANYTIQTSGTFMFDSTKSGSNAWSKSNAFSNLNTLYVENYFNNLGGAAVPLPNSVVLLLSAIAFVGFTRRESVSGSQPTQTSGA
jgi:hypothetical protein